jgi:prepilin-type N-terminal cleavage/methylation domain-containing protein
LITHDRTIHGVATSADNRGMTLIELLIVVLVFGVVVSAALAFMATQNSAFMDGANRLGALRNLRYAVAALETDLTTAGTNVPRGQPAVVYAGDDVFAFTADYTSNVTGDVSAVYVDPSAPAGLVAAPTTSVSIPNTGWNWPDTTYQLSGTNSPAEMIAFWFAPDSSTDRADDYRLYRSVNGGSPDLVARSLLKDESKPFFQYNRKTFDNTGASFLTPIPDTILPLRHDVKMHSTAADTGRFAVIDSIKTVRINIASYNLRESESGGPPEATLSRLVDLPNTGFGVILTCGDEPILGVGITTTFEAQPDGEPALRLNWNAGTDETTGEGDVIRYVIWKRVNGAAWSDPFLSIPAGEVAYTFLDTAVQSGQQVQYALAAQDCTPTLSPRTTGAVVLVP